MNLRLWSSFGTALLLLAPAPLFAQSGKAAAEPPAKAGASRTAKGHPSLEGYWTNATFIPLERPVEMGTKEFFSEAEAAENERRQRAVEQSADDVHYDNATWQGEKYARVVTNRRTSIVFDPPDGRLPPLSAEGQKHARQVAEFFKRRPLSESVQSRSLGERCITWGADGPPMLGATYNANLQIVQTDSAILVHNEMIHRGRNIPFDGSAHIPSAIRQLGGDSRGHWEGDTLVVDTTNFDDRTNFRGPPATSRQDIFSSRDLHVIERFTKTGPDTIQYRFTVEDPSTWTKPWSGELMMRRIQGPIYEYACHEGNYGLTNILSAARAAEK